MNHPDTTPTHARAATLFAVTALAFLALGGLMIAGRPVFLLEKTAEGHGLAWIRIMIYGFGLPAVFGAVYWALPQIFGVALFCRRMAVAHYILHLAGLVAILVLTIKPTLPYAGIGPALIAAGALLFITDVSLSLKRMTQHDAARVFLSTMLLWLALAVSFGVPFTKKPPFSFLQDSNWSAGWLVLVLGGIFFNTLIALASRLLPTEETGGGRSTAAWYALGFLNAGMAWSVSTTTFCLLPNLLYTSSIFLVGALIFLGDFWTLPKRETGWSAKVLSASLMMIPVSAAVLIYNAVHRMGLKPVEVPPEATLPPGAAAAPLMPILSLDWTTGIVALLLTAVPGLVAVLFLLKQSRCGTATLDGRDKVAGQVLLAAFFNYLVGAGLVAVGTWGTEKQMLSLGAILLAVGALGLLGSFLFRLSRTPTSAPSVS